jgi:integrase
VADVQRPEINRDEGSTAAFSKAQARKILDAPPADTLAGLRDRAILSVGLQVGFRRAEIAALKVGDLPQNRGFDALRVIRKGGRREALAINPQAAQRIRAYLEHAGHGAEPDGPLFRPLRGNGKPLDAAGRMDPDAIDRVVRKLAIGAAASSTSREWIGAAFRMTIAGHRARAQRSRLAPTASSRGSSSAPGSARGQQHGRPAMTPDRHVARCPAARGRTLDRG